MSCYVTQGNCGEVLRLLPNNCIDAIVTDPPYGLGKEPDAMSMLADWAAGRDHEIKTKSGGFMGKAWDRFVPQPSVWRECIRVLKPGGHMLAFFGTRTYDIGTLAVRMAGFEIRDQLAWMYGSGMPKSANKKFLPAGWGTALKPAQEPIVLARKPLAGTVAVNVQEYGTGGLNIDGCRVGGAGGRWPANVILDEEAGAILDIQSGFSRSSDRVRHNAAYKGFSKGADLPHTTQGHADSGGASRFFYCAKASTKEREAGLGHLRKASASELAGGRKEGSDGLKNPRAGAGRTSEGRANVHPTVKPIDLMRYLVRLVTPPGGVVLDPFCGSGTTGIAAALEGHRFLGVELDPAYVEIARGRIAHWGRAV